ncbi:MAG: hypothetical protein ACLUKN_00325 [Bacilli bacterium]
MQRRQIDSLNTSNALKDSETQYATIWLSENGSSEIVVNADNHFRGICFRTDNGSNYSDLTITLAKAAIRLSLTAFQLYATQAKDCSWATINLYL